ncbi:related to protein yhhW [Ustilago trichophora]|uniref:Related to protein yhhW n=1 Tax=Ustilago trichophora TaxID=86804 RepID=A0A5C3EPQ6_9BASI|nr:related to protein yhhW [Ustilago trichophora]
MPSSTASTTTSSITTETNSTSSSKLVLPLIVGLLAIIFYFSPFPFKHKTPNTNTSTSTSTTVSTMTSSAAVQAAKLTITPRRWHNRGHADHGWLKTFHTFSFASYFDPSHMQFSNLRVINEDRVAPGTGFGTHPHREAEIFSVVLSGSLEHKDSMGNTEILKRGDVQFTSAGTGIRHSEKNGGKDEVHFLQIWYTPDVSGLAPRYYTTHASDESKRDTLKTLIKPISTFTASEAEKTGLLPQGSPIPSHSTLVTRTSILSPGKSVTHVLGADSAAEKGDERWMYIHLAQLSGYKDPDFAEMGIKGEAQISFSDGQGKMFTLKEGDGAYVKGGKAGDGVEITSTGGRDAEFVLFDLKPQSGGGLW